MVISFSVFLSRRYRARLVRRAAVDVKVRKASRGRMNPYAILSRIMLGKATKANNVMKTAVKNTMNLSTP